MKNSNRDLLILVKEAYTNQEAMQYELRQLNTLLGDFETLESLSNAAAEVVADVEERLGVVFTLLGQWRRISFLQDLVQ